MVLQWVTPYPPRQGIWPRQLGHQWCFLPATIHILPIWCQWLTQCPHRRHHLCIDSIKPCRIMFIYKTMQRVPVHFLGKSISIRKSNGLRAKRTWFWSTTMWNSCMIRKQKMVSIELFGYIHHHPSCTYSQVVNKWVWISQIEKVLGCLSKCFSHV